MTHATSSVYRAPQARKRLNLGLRYFALSFFSLIFVSPILFMIIGSFKPNEKIFDGLSSILPTDLSFNNYTTVIARFNDPASGYFANFYLTSAIVAFVVVVGGLVVNSMAAYALARLRWVGRDIILGVVVVLIILPFEAIVVPLFFMLNGMANTYQVQFIPFIANALSIFLFYTFFVSLPAEIQESARLDGAGPFRVFFSIIVPMSKPVFASVTILTFLGAWSSYLWPLMVVNSPSVRPLPLEIATFKAQPPTDWGQLFAFGVLLIIPVMIVFIAFQRWFIQSVAGSAVKG
jgi:multiple sugar transport system permease protein